jgi:peroxiredoxin
MAGKPLDVSKRIKLYLDDGTVIKHRHSDKYFNPDKYDKLIYLNDDGDVKAFVFTKIEDDIIPVNKNTEIDISKKQKAIYFNLTDINGNHYTLDNLKGKVIVMNYWFSACRPCVMEMPELNKLVAKYQGKDVVFLGLTYHVKANIKRFLQSFQFDYNLIPEAQIEIHNYHVQTYPTHIVIDQDGYVVLREEGLNYDTVDILDKTIEALLKK